MGSIEKLTDIAVHSTHSNGDRYLPTRNALDSPNIQELFSENVTAKIIRTAIKHLENNNPPDRYPHVVPQTGDDAGLYDTKGIDFWTCGFFPGSIYCLLERAIKYPGRIDHGNIQVSLLRQTLDNLGRTWSDPIHGESRLTNTHDMGFIMMTHMKPRWELFHDEAALSSILTSAENLYSRFSPSVGAIRSWDELVWQKLPHITSKADNFIVIIDSLCNLDLLYYAAAHTGHTYLSEAATAHAKTLLSSHLRPEPGLVRLGYSGMLYSTGHMVNFCPKTAGIKEKRTVQGYQTSSTWSRGQAWAILGYAQTYTWTQDVQFLDVACGLVEYFLLRLETAPDAVEIEQDAATKVGRYVPAWDFDAPIEEHSISPLRDTSAGTVAANGMLVLSQALISAGRYDIANRYLSAAIKIVDDTIAHSLSSARATLSTGKNGEVTGVNEHQGKVFEAILRNATVSNSPTCYTRIKDHGLVYADYYLVEFGNKLLRLQLQ